MMETLRVIDLLSGIGGLAKGFQQAGYDIVCSVGNLPIYREIYSQIIENSNFILSDIQQIIPNDLPETDIITAKLRIGNFVNATNRKVYIDQNDVILKIIFEKMPKAFVLEIPSRTRIGNRWEELNRVLGFEGFRHYVIEYNIVQEKKFSGFPINGSQAYMVGIRNDLYSDEFHFPQSGQFERTMFQEEDVDWWYRKISFPVDMELQQGKYYVRERGKLYQTNLIYMGYYKEMYFVDSWGLRRLTHNEYAFLKGFEGYNFNKCSNKRDMYMQITSASNVFVVYAIASELKMYLKNSLSGIASSQIELNQKCMNEP